MTSPLSPLCLSLVLALGLGACSKREVATPVAATPTTATPVASPSPAVAPTPAPAPAPAPVAVTASADLPSECTSYLEKVEACMGKQPGAAAAMRQGIEQTKASWASMGANKAALGSACKAATEAFAQQAAMMKC